jgi:hypothetical protein
MHVETVEVNTHDPLAVYQLVRAHLRDDRQPATPTGISAAIAPGSSTRGTGGGMGDLRAGRAARRRISAITHANQSVRDPLATGVSFFDNFRNKYLERYWLQNAGTWVEGVFFFDDGLAQVQSVDALTSPPAQLLTSVDTYTDVDLTTTVYQFPGGGASNVVYLLARASGVDPNPITHYELYYDVVTGAWQIARFENGFGNVLATNVIAPGFAPLTMRLTVQGDTLRAYLNGVDVSGAVVDGSPLPAGRVGIGASAATFMFDDFRCTAL